MARRRPPWKAARTPVGRARLSPDPLTLRSHGGEMFHPAPWKASSRGLSVGAMECGAPRTRRGA
eukprot:14107970-Alexandrium_andersonii.AAC.1